MFYQSIPGVDEAVSEVTSEPGTPNDNKPITASRARGHTLKFTTHGNQYHSKRSVVSHQLNSDGRFPGNFWWISCATSTSLRFWVQVTCIFSNFIESEVFDREWGGTYSTFVF